MTISTNLSEVIVCGIVGMSGPLPHCIVEAITIALPETLDPLETEVSYWLYERAGFVVGYESLNVPHHIHVCELQLIAVESILCNNPHITYTCASCN